MEHIIKQTETETIKRFELANKNIWLVKRFLPVRGIFGYGIGESKKKAEAAAHTNQTYAYKGIPDFITQIGSTYKTNNKSMVNSMPAGINFIWQMIPITWQRRFFFRVIIDQNTLNTFVEVAFASEVLADRQPLWYWSDDKAGCFKQIENCIYEFYKDMETPFEQKKQHPKLAEWRKNWYSKLQPRRAL